MVIFNVVLKEHHTLTLIMKVKNLNEIPCENYSVPNQ